MFLQPNNSEFISNATDQHLQQEIMSTNIPLDEPIPIEYFKITRKIKCLPLLEPKLLDDNLKRLKHKRRNIKRAVKRIVKKRN